MLEVLDLDPSRLDLSTTSFVVNRLTSDRLHCRSPDLRRIKSGLDSNSPRRCSPDLRQASSSLLGLRQPSWWPLQTSTTTSSPFFIFVFVREALTVLALTKVFFDGDEPRRLWRVWDIAASVVSVVCCGSVCGVCCGFVVSV
ncbi:hypothetical protein Acr_22g0003890 [Actinidia rufa]|uniref:Uncharacterized protein n=1 Tax=Actinidia rufa TaxID=165716 RepID=A0A7J0GJS9_9ERIC|nr:hypothetical protein Acr_22g0003890 [Actinidia rufa]